MKSSFIPAMHDVVHLLEEWKNVTLAEKGSIVAEDWTALKSLQERKQLLQALIDKAETILFSPRTSSSHQSLARQRLKAIAEELVQLEAANRDLLADKMARTDLALKEMDKAARSLRHVHRAYGSSDRSFWQAYS